MKATVRWSGKMSFEGRSESGHSVTMDGSPDIGGENRGPRPMEMLLLGLGGCTAIDVMLILGKGRQDVTDCVVHIDAERASTEPKVFTKIHVHFVVSGRKLDPKRVEKAIQLSAEKYCSASIMLGKTATMSHDFEIVEVA
jgi:putative redox protein